MRTVLQGVYSGRLQLRKCRAPALELARRCVWRSSLSRKLSVHLLADELAPGAVAQVQHAGHAEVKAQRAVAVAGDVLQAWGSGRSGWAAASRQHDGARPGAGCALGRQHGFDGILGARPDCAYAPLPPAPSAAARQPQKKEPPSSRYATRHADYTLPCSHESSADGHSAGPCSSLLVPAHCTWMSCTNTRSPSALAKISRTSALSRTLQNLRAGESRRALI